MCRVKDLCCVLSRNQAAGMPKEWKVGREAQRELYPDKLCVPNGHGCLNYCKGKNEALVLKFMQAMPFIPDLAPPWQLEH